MNNLADIAESYSKKLSSIRSDKESVYLARVISGIISGEIDLLELDLLEEEMAKRGHIFNHTLEKLPISSSNKRY